MSAFNPNVGLVQSSYFFRVLIWWCFWKLSLLLESCLYPDAEVQYMLSLFSDFLFFFFFFAAFIIFMLGYPVQNLRLLFCNFAQVFILPFTEFYSFCPSSFLDNFMKLWSMHYSFFFYFCSFLTLSNNFSLDECLKILLMYLKSLVSFFVALSLLVLVLIDMMLKNLI